MKYISFFLTALLLINFSSFSQNINITNVPVTSTEIIKAKIQSHIPNKVNNSTRTITTTTVLENGYILESKMGQYWDGADWVNSFKDLFTYTPEGLKSEEINQLWNNNQWENSRRFLTTYNMSSLISLYEEFTWNGSSWENSYQYHSTYNNNDQLVEYNVLQWNASSWDSLYKTTYTYTGSGNLEQTIDLSWVGSAWENEYKNTYQFNANDNVSKRLEEEWIEGNWKNSIKDTFYYNLQNQLEHVISFWWPDSFWKESVAFYYQYDGSGNITDKITKFWESEILGLQNKYHTVYEYLPDTSLVTKVENQEWNLQSGIWFNTSREIYTYTDENKIENLLGEGWDGTAWMPGFQELYSYDENGNLDIILSQYWDGSQWVNTFKASHTWSSLVSVEEDLSNLPVYSLEQNYPNPFNPITSIVFTIASDAEVSLTIYDILGNEITNLISGNLKAGIHEVKLNAGELTSGVYFYRLKAVDAENKSSFTSVKKMLLLK